MAVKNYSAGVKEYRETYWMPDYIPKDTDILACFKVTPQAGVPREEVAAAVAAESSTGTWTKAAPALLTPTMASIIAAFRPVATPTASPAATPRARKWWAIQLARRLSSA